MFHIIIACTTVLSLLLLLLLRSIDRLHRSTMSVRDAVDCGERFRASLCAITTQYSSTLEAHAATVAALNKILTRPTNAAPRGPKGIFGPPSANEVQTAKYPVTATQSSNREIDETLVSKYDERGTNGRMFR